MLRAQKRILQKQKLLGTLNINISASLRGEKWRWLHFHSWCEHSWETWASPARFQTCARRGNVDVFGQKCRSCDYSGSEGGQVPERIWVCQRCDVPHVLFHISPARSMPQCIHQNAYYSNKPYLLCMQQKNWENNHLHLICEPSEYGWSDELTIIIQSTKGG